MPQENQCPQCSKPLPSGSPRGLCPACLLKCGLQANTVDYTADGPSSQWTPPPIEQLAGLFPELDILELLGRGGMGAVYKARQKELDRLVALKILPPEIGRDPSFAQRFAREAQAMARLSHPNIVMIHDFGRRGPADQAAGGGVYFFLMEYIDGLSLRQVLNSGGVGAKEALAIVPQICDALQYAHDHGIVHRDIKPENILLNRAGQVKIADFGLAKLVGLGTSGGETSVAAGDMQGPLSPEEAHVTVAGEQIMGTPRYMAPEQIERPREVDNRADIYSLGVVFYQMLTGDLPKGKFEPPSRKVLIDVRLDEVVLRALEKEPARRYQQVSQVKTEVETIVATGAAVTSATRAVGSSRRQQEHRGYHPWHWAIGAMFAVGVGVIVLPYISRQFTPPAVTPQSQPSPVSSPNGYAQQMREASARRLHRIGELLTSYAADHNAVYPMLTAPEEDLANYAGPSDEKDGSLLKYIRANVNYLAAGKTRTGAASAAVAYDRTLLKFAEGTNVLFEDGHVEFIEPARFEQLGITLTRDYPVDLPNEWKPFVSCGKLTVVGSPFYAVRSHKWFAGWPHVQIRWSLKNLTDKPLELRVQYKSQRATGGHKSGFSMTYRLSPHQDLAIDDLVPVMSAVVPEIVYILPEELRNPGGKVIPADGQAIVTTDPIPPQASQQMAVHAKDANGSRLVVKEAKLVRSQDGQNVLELAVANREKTALPLVVFAAAGDTARTDTADRTNAVEAGQFFEARQQVEPGGQCVVRVPFSIPSNGPNPLLVFTLFEVTENLPAAGKPIEREDVTPVCWGGFDLKKAANQAQVSLPAYEPVEERVKLTSQTRSEHFVFRYRERSYAQEHIQAAVQAREKAYQELKKVLKMDLPKIVTIDLYNDMEAKGVGSGTYYTPANTVNDTHIAEVYNDSYHCDPHHELAHLFAYNLPGRGRLPDNECLTEAFAVRLESGAHENVEQTRTALKGRLAAGKLMPLSDLLLAQKDGKQTRYNQDTEACMVFLEFLAGRDIEQFKKFYPAIATNASTVQDLESICHTTLNISLQQLEQQWHKYLTTPPASATPPASEMVKKAGHGEGDPQAATRPAVNTQPAGHSPTDAGVSQ